MICDDKKTTENLKPLLDFSGACSFLNVKKSWLRMACFKKVIPYTKVGRLLRFDVADLREWLSQNTIK